MITNERDRRICNKYKARDQEGKVHCNKCPLNKGNPTAHDFRCKANSFYNRKTKEWEYHSEDDYFVQFLNEVEEIAVRYGFNIGGHSYDKEAEMIEMLLIPALGMDSLNRKF